MNPQISPFSTGDFPIPLRQRIENLGSKKRPVLDTLCNRHVLSIVSTFNIQFTAHHRYNIVYHNGLKHDSWTLERVS